MFESISEIKEDFFKQFKTYELITNRKNIDNYLYKTEDKNGKIHYHYFLNVENQKLLENICYKHSFFLNWKENTDYKDKNIIIYTLENKGEKTLKSYITQYHNEELMEKDRISNQKKIEEKCREIMINLYEILKILKDKYFLFSLNNINTIVIKKEKNNNISIKLNPFEMVLSYYTTKLFSGTKISQAPQKIIYYTMCFQNVSNLKIFGNIAKFILTCKFEKNNIYAIPILSSTECKNFLRTCFLNLKLFEDLNELDFLNKEKSFSSFHFPDLKEISVNSYMFSYVLDPIPKKKIESNELNFSADNKYTVLELNSFCIKPEDNEKIDIKKAYKNLEERGNEIKNNPDYKMDPMDSILFYNYYLKDEIKKPCNIEELFKIILEHREKEKEEAIKKELDKMPIYTYPIKKNN